MLSGLFNHFYRFRIIDNDIGVNGGSNEESKNSGKGRLGSKIGGALTDEDEDEEDTYALGEEKPQIAALVDDRPPELTGKWKRLNKDNEGAAKQRKRHDRFGHLAHSWGTSRALDFPLNAASVTTVIQGHSQVFTREQRSKNN